jgi:hypothetical protein
MRVRFDRLGRRRSVVVGLSLLAGLSLAAASTATAQTRPTTPVTPDVVARAIPDTVTVGDRFLAVARIVLPAGARATLSVEPSDTSAVQLAGTPRLHPPDAKRGDYLAAVPLVAWRTGTPPPVSADLRVTEGNGRERITRIPLALPYVRSVLPRDTAGVKPRGAKDVLDAPKDWRALAILAAAVLLAVLLLAVLTRSLVRLLWRPRRARPGDARAAALAALERARASGLAERGEWEEFYAAVADALRGFAAAVVPGWGPELTTGELAARMESNGVAPEEVAAVHGVLAAADLAKFARRRFTPDEAARDLDTAREWVRRFDPAVVRLPTPEEDGESGVETPVEAGR